MSPWDSDPDWAQRQGVKQAVGLVIFWITLVALGVFLGWAFHL